MTQNLLALMFWIFWAWRMFGTLFHFLSRKEQYSIDCILDTVLILLNGTEVFRHLHKPGLALGMYIIFTVLFVVYLKRDYKRWKNTDDDDDKNKKRRRAWIKNHLPKPITKKIPVPI